MGYYIETGCLSGKAKSICDRYDAIIIPQPESFHAIPPDLAIICVIDNGPFEAAGYCYSPREFEEFSDPMDSRRKTWLLIDKKLAEDLTNFNKK